MEVPLEQQQQPSQVVGGETNMTPEQQEEMKLRMKYPNPHKPGGSTFIQKMLHRGNKKYFDSGDYNMAKSRTKAALNSGATTTIPNNGQLTAQKKEEQMMNPNSVLSTVDDQVNNSQNSSANVMDTTGSLMSPPSYPSSTLSHHDVNNESTTTSNISATTIVPNLNLNQSNLYHHDQGAHSPPAVRLVPNASPTQQSLTFSSSQLSSSLSSSNIGGNLMISSSLSSDKLSTSIALNNLDQSVANSDLLLLDSDEIGHGIPTPECLPQSRKHSMTQSKLVGSPNLSTSSS